MSYEVAPYSREELWEAFSGDHSPGRHLLTVYSAVVGLQAQRAGEIGIGATTRALRAALRTTGGHLWSCDGDIKRFSDLLAQQDDGWTLTLSRSEDFLQAVDGPLDLFMHDGAHDYHQVKLDLDLILPKMRTFGLVLIHDTQQTDLARDLLAAVRDATKGWLVSWTTLPYNAGLGILRVEAGRHPPVSPTGGLLHDGRFDTTPVAFPVTLQAPDLGDVDSLAGRVRRQARRRLRRAIKGY
jgi:hypothetical protein